MSETRLAVSTGCEDCHADVPRARLSRVRVNDVEPGTCLRRPAMIVPVTQSNEPFVEHLRLVNVATLGTDARIGAAAATTRG